ncbi:MAG TPA: DNA repair protein RadC [Kofleriaceae bacterium]|nr:DNA repair protein RadC [Kofleriaceae bacterium]
MLWVAGVYDDADSNDGNDERPRERLLYEGVDHVSDAELISLVLGHGTRRLPVGDIAHHLLREIGGVASLARASPHELIGFEGVGEAQAARLIAAVQLGRRALARERRRIEKVASPDAIFDRLQPRFAGLEQEVVVVVAINARGSVIAEIEVARGTLARVDVHPRDVFRPLIKLSAACGVVAHNHPSGDPTPSEQDLDLTHRLRECGHIIGIPILDHIVITDDDFASIAEVLGVPLLLPD